MDATFTIHIHTLGCKVNQYDSGALLDLFRRNGFKPYPGSGAIHGAKSSAKCSALNGASVDADVCESVDSGTKDPDVVVVNTCIVSAESERKSRQAIRKMRATYPSALLAVVGCYPQRFYEQASMIEGVDYIAGISGHIELVDKITQRLCGCTQNRSNDKIGDGIYSRICNAEPSSGEKHGASNLLARDGLRTREYIKIQDGCDSFCSYCIIPYTRGRARSRSLPDIIKEVSISISRGAPEIVLTGIHISSYDYQQKIGLGELIDAVAECMDSSGGKNTAGSGNIFNKTRPRLHLSSLEPTIVTPGFVRVLSKNRDIICPHFHLSLQSGSESILRRMNRKYTPSAYTEAVAMLRAEFPDAAITTDIIIGFPGESENEFLETLEFCRAAAFYKIHVFPYSKRPGTRAAELPDQISPQEKQKRVKQLIALSDELSLAFHEKYIGTAVQILIENVSGNCISGLTANYIKVRAKCENGDATKKDYANRGSFAIVHIKDITATHMNGTQLGSSKPLLYSEH